MDVGKWHTEDETGLLTFYGVYQKHYETVAEFWKSRDTLKAYEQDYHRYLFDFFDKKALADCTQEDFDGAIESVRQKLIAEELVSHDTRMRHFRHLIRRVTHAAEVNGVCPDILWGTRYLTRERDSTDESASRRRLKRSLTPQEETRVFNAVMTDAGQDGENMGLALMFCLGTRNNETAALDFGDVRVLELDSDCHVAWIHASVKQNSAKKQNSGKTRNANRVIPLPDKLWELIQRRRKWIAERALADLDLFEELVPSLCEEKLELAIDRLPIACDGQELTKRCTSGHLTLAGKRLLREDVMLDESSARAMGDEMEQQPISEPDDYKDPTVYLLRRNFATRLYQLQMTPSQIEYLMGHDISEDGETRAFMRSDEVLVEMWKRLRRRFIVNDMTQTPVILDPEQEGASFENATRLALVLPISGKCQRYRLHIESSEPGDRLQIRAAAEGTSVEVRISQHPHLSAKPAGTSVEDVARKQYSSAQEAVEKKKHKLLTDG